MQTYAPGLLIRNLFCSWSPNSKSTFNQDCKSALSTALKIRRKHPQTQAQRTKYQEPRTRNSTTSYSMIRVAAVGNFRDRLRDQPANFGSRRQKTALASHNIFRPEPGF